MDLKSSNIIKELEEEAKTSPGSASRIYRALGESSVGIRAGFIPRDRIVELLIEIPPKWENKNGLPEWRGMKFEILKLSLPPREDVHHLRLYLEDHEHKPVFLTFCKDLVEALEGIIDSEIRVKAIEECIQRWGRFFEKCGSDGLSPSAQRGLFAELTWIQNLLDKEIRPIDAVSSWKGCERGYQDFDLDGDVVEIKSTMTKEPRIVRISSERQLDDRGLRSLHLFVLTLHSTEGGGTTLPAIIQAIRDALASSSAATSKFERCLINTGYLHKHADRYNSNYIVKKEELFEVREGFPRIINLPQGVGHLRYSVTISACKSFLTSLTDYLEKLIGA